MSSLTLPSSGIVLDYSGTANETSTPARVSNPGQRINVTVGNDIYQLFSWMCKQWLCKCTGQKFGNITIFNVFEKKLSYACIFL